MSEPRIPPYSIESEQATLACLLIDNGSWHRVSDLMDCGPVEQVADQILMLYRDEHYRADSPEPGTVELIIAKQRNGPTGRASLVFNAERGQFDDIGN